MQTTTTASVPSLQNLTLADLGKMNLKELEAVYALSTTPTITGLDGAADGLVLAGLVPVDKFPFMPWKGKIFKPLSDSQGVGTNRIAQPGGGEKHEFEFRYFVTAPLIGRDEVVELDYDLPVNSPKIQAIRDDLKQVNDTLYLGACFKKEDDRYEFLLYFGLQFPAA